MGNVLSLKQPESRQAGNWKSQCSNLLQHEQNPRISTSILTQVWMLKLTQVLKFKLSNWVQSRSKNGVIQPKSEQQNPGQPLLAHRWFLPLMTPAELQSECATQTTELRQRL